MRRYLLSWNRFVCWLSMCGCVPFWVEADSFADWDWGDALPSELKQIRLLIEYVGMRSLISWYSFVSEMSMWRCVSFWVEADSFACLRLSGFVRFWVEANSFTDWDWGDSLHFEWLPIRFLIEKWGCVCFWVEANSFNDWVCEDAFPFK